jgi:hypothetical protein
MSQPMGGVGRSIRRDYRELVSTPSGPDICDAHRSIDRVCGRAQHTVADGMASFVVDRLESVDVDQQEREWGV